MSNSAFSQSAAPSSFADLTGVPDDNAALAAALAGKANISVYDPSLDPQIYTVSDIRVYAGSTDIDGRLIADLATDFPGIQYAYLISGCSRDAGTPLMASEYDATVATFTVQYFAAGGTPVADGFQVSFTVAIVT